MNNRAYNLVNRPGGALTASLIGLLLIKPVVHAVALRL